MWPWVFDMGFRRRPLAAAKPDFETANGRVKSLHLYAKHY